MEILHKKHAAPTLEIGAIAGLTVHEIEEAVNELEKEGLIRLQGGPQLYNQIAILKRSTRPLAWQDFAVLFSIIFAIFVLYALMRR